MPNAYIYSRFSTPQQEHGNSLERQRELCESFCARRGWTIADRIEDKGKSAWKGDHLRSGNLGKFAARVRSGDIEPGSILVVEQLDRLSRLDPRTAQRWMEDLCEIGLKIATVEGEKVYDEGALRGPDQITNILMILIKAQVANEHSNRKSALNYDNWARRFARAKEGKIISRRVPAWLSVIDGEWKIDDTKAETVRAVYRWSVEGQGNRMIATALNEAKVPSFGGRGTKWTDKYVGLLLHSPAVEGDYIPGASNGTGTGERIVGYFPRIVDASVVAQARTASDSRRGTGGRYRRLSTNLFAQGVTCGCCGGPMTLRPRQSSKLSPTSVLRKGLFKCRNSMSGRGCEQRQMFAYAAFEVTALNEVLHLALDNRFFTKANETIGVVNEVAQIEKDLKDATDQQASAVNLSIKNPEIPAYQDRAAELQRSIMRLKDELEEARKRLNKARGAVDASEHQRRVFEVRDLLDDPDEATRTEARRKVAEAIRAMGVSVVCEVQDGYRQYVLTFSKILRVVIDTKGEVIDKLDVMQLFKDQTPETLTALEAHFKTGLGASPVTPALTEKANLLVARHARGAA
ncbi:MULTISPECIES: recombinase family protein [unclassified Caulobacter]|uniref:recombinase family protein n=1 Tax=unclassified Caulobacter TaxID=2648921 RepID=UPI000D399705|nr:MULTISPECIES: recombinase family protein [unclassified Caulobacter]PTS81678.1 hypothetical protein DBR21_18900 [Caulobacter sp. HMWF009]PTT04981.1 hypothetical protein DBR10_17065 [Caulobacter sp. HMWF025]